MPQDSLTNELMRRVPINMRTGEVATGNELVPLRYTSPEITKESPNPQDLLRRFNKGDQFRDDAYKGSLYPENDPAGAVQLGMLHLKDEYPAEVAAINGEASPMNRLDKLRAPNAMAITSGSPLGPSVRYDPQSISIDQRQNEDLLAHELTHVKQYLREGRFGGLIGALMENLTKKYLDRPHEIEAIKAADDRAFSRKDLEIPSVRLSK